PEGICRDVVELADRVDARYEDPEPAGELAAAEQAERGQQHANAQEQHDPAPRVQIAEHESLVTRVDPRVRDREDTLEDRERPAEAEHHGCKGDPPAASDVVRVRAAV